MKSTFKKALAAVSAAAVVATSAAVFTAVPAQALNTPSVGQVTVTMDELQSSNYLVTVPVYIAGNTDGWDSLAFGLQWNADELTYSKGVAGASVLGAMGEGVAVNTSGFQVHPQGIGGWVTYATTPTGDGPTYVTGDGAIINITFKVTENAQPGDIYYIDGLERSYDGAYVPKITHGDESLTGAPSQGYIQIEGVQTTTTEATTTTTTTVATTTASGETTTAGSTTTVDPNADNIGDVNLDGIVDIADAVTLNKYLAGVVQLSDQALRNANCDQSPSDIDNVGDKDTTALVRFVLNMEGYQDLPFIAAE